MHPGGTLFWHTSSSLPLLDLLSSMRSLVPSPFGCSANGKWRAAAARGSCTSGAWETHFVSYVVIHATVMSKHLRPLSKPKKVSPRSSKWIFLLYWLLQHREAKPGQPVLHPVLAEINRRCHFLASPRKEKKKLFQSKWIYGQSPA